MSDALEGKRIAANSWRGQVAITLRSLGLSAASARLAARHSRDYFSVEPDLFGVPGIHLLAPATSVNRASTYLTRARQQADERGLGDVPVVVVERQRSEPEDALVIMRLADFSRLVLDAQRSRSAAPEAEG